MVEIALVSLKIILKNNIKTKLFDYKELVL